jgi:hypothetical protein
LQWWWLDTWACLAHYVMLWTNETERKKEKNDEHEIDEVEIGYCCLYVHNCPRKWLTRYHFIAHNNNGQLLYSQTRRTFTVLRKGTFSTSTIWWLYVNSIYRLDERKKLLFSSFRRVLFKKKNIDFKDDSSNSC